jgi:hypothetical protein
MSRTLRAAILMALLHFSAAAGAVDYYWWTAGYSDQNFPSPAAACAYRAQKDEENAAKGYQFHATRLYATRIDPSKTAARCDIYYVYEQNESAWNYKYPVYPDRWTYTGPIAYRGGDGCSEGVYNETLGQCEAPPKDCEATKGEPFPAKGADAPVVNSGGRNYVADAGPPTACYEQCQYKSESGRSTSCYLVKGSTTQGFCNYILNGSGESCSADSYQFSTTGDPLNPSTEPPDPAVPPSDPNDPGCADGWKWSGTTCVKADPSNPGDGSGDGDGDGEGGGNTGGGTGGGDGSGNGDGSGSGNGDGSGSGNGDGSGSGNGDGSGSGNGDGEGDGEGQCDPAKDPNGCQGEGPGTELKEPDAGSWDEANKEWDQKVQDAKKELKDAVKANIDQLKGAFDLQLSTGGGQLPCYTGTVWGKPYRLCVSDYADQLSNMRLALLLMAALIAAFVILKE